MTQGGDEFLKIALIRVEQMRCCKWVRSGCVMCGYAIVGYLGISSSIGMLFGGCAEICGRQVEKKVRTCLLLRK